MNRSEIMEQFEQVLANTISPNHLDSTAASDFLENVIATDIASVFLALSRIMADDRLGAPIRKQAGLKLKKVVYSHEIDPEINESRWLQLPADIRAQIKAHCYQALCMQDQVSDMAAQCVARVARVELPGGHWPELMDLLYTQITDYNSPDLVKRACILAIGYICYDIDPDILQPEIVNIYGSIITLLAKDQNNRVRLAAAFAMRQFLGAFIFELHDQAVREKVIPDVCRFVAISDNDIGFWLLQGLQIIMRHYYSRMQFREPRDLYTSFFVKDLRMDQNTARYLLQQIISAFGDFAFLLGDSFAQYRGQVIDTLIQACQPEVHLDDPDMIDYLNTLRQCCIEAFVRLILSARSSGNGNQYPSTAQDNIEQFQLIIPHMQVIIPFMEHIAAQQVSSEELIGACCGLVGDIATGFGIASLEILDTESIKMLLAKGSKCGSMSTKKYAAWAIKEMNKLRSM